MQDHNAHQGWDSSHSLSSPLAILCDMDGVLVDSEQLHWDSVLLTVQHILNQSSQPTLPLRIGWDDTQLWQELKETYQLPISVADCIQIRKEIANTLLNDQGVILMDGVYDTLSTIKKNYPHIKLAVVSASLKEHMHMSLQKIAHLFDYLVSGFDDCSHNKPHPMPYLHASALIDVPIQSCWILEDSTPGLQAALASKAQVFAVHAHHSDAQLRTACVAQLDHFTELLHYLSTTEKNE